MVALARPRRCSAILPASLLTLEPRAEPLAVATLTEVASEVLAAEIRCWSGVLSDYGSQMKRTMNCQ
jgi:hypothetical protein